jgi:hypothetical protein
MLRSLEDRETLERRAARAGVTLPVPVAVGAESDSLDDTTAVTEPADSVVSEAATSDRPAEP